MTYQNGLSFLCFLSLYLFQRFLNLVRERTFFASCFWVNKFNWHVLGYVKEYGTGLKDIDANPCWGAARRYAQGNICLCNRTHSFLNSCCKSDCFKVAFNRPKEYRDLLEEDIIDLRSPRASSSSSYPYFRSQRQIISFLNVRLLSLSLWPQYIFLHYHAATFLPPHTAKAAHPSPSPRATTHCFLTM